MNLFLARPYVVLILFYNKFKSMPSLLELFPIILQVHYKVSKFSLTLLHGDVLSRCYTSDLFL